MLIRPFAMNGLERRKTATLKDDGQELRQQRQPLAEFFAAYGELSRGPSQAEGRR